MFDQIEKLKTDLTDKYVLVDATIPELARFEGHVGQVKTVNMNGRALVQFDTWNNIGWYDIDVDCLRVVAKPDPAAVAAKQPDAKKEAPRAAKPAAATADAPAGAKKLSPLEMARMQGAAKSGGAAPAKAVAPAKDKPAAPAAGGKKSVADILAAARANKAGAAEATAAAPAKAPPVVEAATEKVAPAPVAAKPAGKAATLKPGQRLNVAEILAWCREHDAK
jgi:hypothetical protein